MNLDHINNFPLLPEFDATKRAAAPGFDWWTVEQCAAIAPLIEARRDRLEAQGVAWNPYLPQEATA